MRLNIRYWLLCLSVPIQKWMQKLHPPEPQTKYTDAITIRQLMKQGDILLSREAWHFTNIFIPGYWSHAAIYGMGKNGCANVIEAVGTGCQEVDFIDWVMRKHNWCVLRPAMSSTETGVAAFKSASQLVGSEYDYFFKPGNKAWYCSELVFQAWRDRAFWFSAQFTRRKTFGEYAVTPDDFYGAVGAGKLRIIHEHRDV